MEDPLRPDNSTFFYKRSLKDLQNREKPQNIKYEVLIFLNSTQAIRAVENTLSKEK